MSEAGSGRRPRARAAIWTPAGQPSVREASASTVAGGKAATFTSKKRAISSGRKRRSAAPISANSPSSRRRLRGKGGLDTAGEDDLQVGGSERQQIPEVESTAGESTAS